MTSCVSIYFLRIIFSRLWDFLISINTRVITKNTILDAPYKGAISTNWFFIFYFKNAPRKLLANVLNAAWNWGTLAVRSLCAMKHNLHKQGRHSLLEKEGRWADWPLALDGAELIIWEELERIELRLEEEGLGWKTHFTVISCVG